MRCWQLGHRGLCRFSSFIYFSPQYFPIIVGNAGSGLVVLRFLLVYLTLGFFWGGPEEGGWGVRVEEGWRPSI